MKSALIHSFFSLMTGGGAGDKLTILQFHKVPQEYDPLVPGELLLDRFEQVLDFFTEHMNVLSLSDAIRAMANNRLPKRAVALTLDDGYAEWVDFVAPALRRRNLPATFYVTTQQLTGGALWHERIVSAVRALPERNAMLPVGFQNYSDLSAITTRARLALQLQERFKYLPLQERNDAIEQLECQAGQPLILPKAFDADSVRSLHSQGFEIGAHTVCHPILKQIGETEAKEEIGGCKETLEGIIGGKVLSFAYPNGLPSRDYSDRHVDLVRACGYQSAVVTGGGVADNTTDFYQLPRFTPWGPGPGRMALQIARNIRSRSRGEKLAASNTKPRRIMVVENGAGFGGAIIALQTLLENVSKEDGEFHVVTNLPVGHFETIPAVKSVTVIGDRLVNFRAFAQKINSTEWLVGRRGLLFLIGRLDDLINRLPYMTRLYFHALLVRPEILHGNNEPSSNREAMIVARLFRRPYVQHVRGAIASSLHTPWLLKAPDAFIPVSRWLAEELLTNGVPSSRIHQIYDAVDIPLPAAKQAVQNLRESLGLAADTVLVAMVGMLVAWKGQGLFIDAVSQMSKTKRDVAFLVIGGTPELGDSSYAESLQRQVQELGLSQQISFTGRRDDLKALLPQIDVVVSASTEPEPLGLVMLEAMVSGCIFVGPAHGAAVEVVTDGKNGFLFEPGSPSSLAEKLEQAIHQKQYGGFDRLNISREINDIFSGKRCGNSTCSIYQILFE